MRVATWIVLSLSVPAVWAQSFEAFRLHSGMNPEQVQRAVPGYEVRWGQIPGTAFLLKGDDIYASLAFCNNELVAVDRTIDPDTDVLTYLQEYLRDYGQPQVTVQKDAWTGHGGGDITSIQFRWTRDGVGRTLSLIPEGRTGSGELRHTRNGSLGFFLEHTPCVKK